jgi:arylsulfatase A-like enzyme/Flp pilus assembly protein TadD
MKLRLAAVLLALAAIVLVVSWVLFYPGADSKPSLLLITLDTTRADRLGSYGYREALTPALDRLASEGVSFEQAFASVPITLPSHATLMTGLQPPEHGIRVNGTQKLDIGAPTLAELLREEGYQTAAFVASATLDSKNGLDRGFDLYDDSMSSAYPYDRTEPLTAYRPGNEVTDLALNWLKERDGEKPFFCWLHLFDPHHPYFAHEELAGTPFEGRSSYDAEVAFMDIQVGRMLDYLEQEALRDKVLVVAVGDHGEGLGDDREHGHGHMLYEVTLRVPLILSRPGSIPQGVREDAMVSLVDLFGTMLDLIGLERDEGEWSGRSLLPAFTGTGLNSMPCYGETDLPYRSFGWSPLRSLTTPEWKYIRSTRRHLYDRQSDPRERANLVDINPEIADELDSELLALERSMIPHQAAAVDLSQEDLERLAALGYVAGSQGSASSEAIDYASLRDVEDMVPVLELLREAREAGRENRSEELIALLSEMRILSPESVVFRERLAIALLTQGRLEEGVQEIQEYLRLMPADADAHYVLGVAHARRNDPISAARSFLEVLRIRPGDSRANEAMATLLRQRNDPVGASRHQVRPSNIPAEAIAHYDLGVLLNAEGRLEEAVGEFERALVIAPQDLPARYRLASLLELMGDQEGADAQHAEALRFVGDDPAALLKMSELLAAKGNPRTAILYVTKALELDPSDAEARSRLAKLRQELRGQGGEE